MMNYEYFGYLKTILEPPAESARDDLDSVLFSADDIAEWGTKDLPAFLEWQRVPAHRSRTEDGVALSGRFEDIRIIDCLPAGEPSFWAPLGSLNSPDDRFPVDTEKYPILEVTYRCTSDSAVPAIVWSYPGGFQYDWLPPGPRWRTVARRIPYGAFPGQVDAVILRVYSATRSTESIEVESIRFRAMTADEARIGEPQSLEAGSTESDGPKHYPILDEFLPLGVYADSEMARRLAETLGISFSEYWGLALEDIVKHHHNCVALEGADHLTSEEWGDVLAKAEEFNVKLIPIHGMPAEDDDQQLRETVETRIRPSADSSAIFAWGISPPPSETDFGRMIRMRKEVEQADPNHPLTFVSHQPNAFPLLAPHFSASGMNQFTSHSPWDLEKTVCNHITASKGQQFWMVAPAFIGGTGAPEWSSCPEMRLMVNASFASGVRGWFTYAYHNNPIWLDGSSQRTLTGPFLTFSDLWQELARRMERVSALAPLLLETHPEPIPEGGYDKTFRSEDDKAKLPDGVPLTSEYRLLGNEYSLFFMVSNDIRGMASINIKLNPDFLKGYEIYDLSDAVLSREWTQMNLDRHLEMFPGQVRVFLVGKSEVCQRARDIVVRRLIGATRQLLPVGLNLAKAYGLDVGPVERAVDSAASENALEELAETDLARDMLQNLIYTKGEIAGARSGIIDASAALCACDGALCRLHSNGKVAQARELGLRVVPLAREVTNLRLELRQGRGEAVIKHCEALSKRVLSLLTEIRSQT